MLALAVTALLTSLPVHAEAPLLDPSAVSAAAEPSAAASSPGVQDPALADLLAEHWDWLMGRWPLWATQLGDHRFDDRLDDISARAIAADHRVRQRFAGMADKVARRELSDADRTTLEIFRLDLARGLATDACRTEQWGLSARNNPLVILGSLPESVRLDTPAAQDAYLSRLRAFPRYVADDTANLRAGIAAGRTPDGDSVDIVVAQLDAQLERPAADWSVVTPLEKAGRASEAEQFVTTLLVPALRGYRAFLATTLRPAARGPDGAGVWALPDGDACYAALAARETSLTLSPDEIHATGLRELEAIHAEFRVLGQRVFGTSDLPTIFARLREDPELRFTTENEVEAAAVEALAAARAAIPTAFGRLPKAECGVRRVPEHEAPYTTIAYYWPAVPDEAPGYYTINTHAPETRPRFEARALAFHESIPGHHLQIAIAQELPALPTFRRHLGTTAFVEGWALYTERLADELGLYRDDLDRLGLLSFDAWRATRLVVDTGIHAKRWTRAQAVDFFLANTPLAENNIRNEVDRYVTWPGQALAYKLGQIELRTLRTEAEAALGPAFSLPGFHDAVLGGGAVPLPVLRQQVEAWVRSRKAAP
jgi:uncharacterized protein (DUF885 family)